MKDFFGRYSHLVNGVLAGVFILFLFYLGSSMRTETQVEYVSESVDNEVYPTAEEVEEIHPPQNNEQIELVPSNDEEPIDRDTVIVEMIEDTNESEVEAFGAELVAETEQIEHEEEAADTNEVESDAVEVDTFEVKVDTVDMKTDTTVTDTTNNQ